MNSAPVANVPSLGQNEQTVPSRDTSWPLKAALLLDGVATDSLPETWLQEHGHCVRSLPDRSRVEIELATGTVFAPLLPRNTTWPLAPRLVLDGTEGAVLLWNGTRVPVRLPPTPECYEARTTSGRTIGEFTVLLGDVLVLGGMQACGYSISGTACRFCRVGSRSESERTFGVSPHEAAEAVRAAQAERRIRWVLLPAASFDAEDGGVREIEPIIRAVRRHTAAFVLVSLHPPRNMRWIDHAYAIGVDGVSFNLEFPDVTVLERFLPGRARYLGRSRYVQALRHAAKIFPRGAVWTEVITGASSEAQDREWLHQLLDWNVVPCLVPFGTAQTVRPLSAPLTVPLEHLHSLLLFLDKAPSALARSFSWLPAWPHLLRADDVFPAGTAQRTASRVQHRVGERLGDFLLRNLSRIRRSLRVRDLEEHDAERPI